MDLFLSPHNDDETLFGAFTLLRRQPLVVIVTDSYIQWNRGDGVSADDRWRETQAAMRVLGCSAVRLGCRDDALSESMATLALQRFTNVGKVYVPARQGGHRHHDLIHDVATRVFPHCVCYTTYTSQQPFAPGDVEIVPTSHERARKEQALACYFTQWRSPGFSHRHFEAVRGQSEWYLSVRVYP